MSAMDRFHQLESARSAVRSVLRRLELARQECEQGEFAGLFKAYQLTMEKHDEFEKAALQALREASQ